MDNTTVVVVAAVLLVIVYINAFALVGYDKKCARQGKWRVPEFLTAACFGGLGGVMGMKVFHHKTKHSSNVLGLYS